MMSILNTSHAMAARQPGFGERWPWPARITGLPSCGAQRGIALVMSILFLLLLTLIGVTSMNTSVLQERMAGNIRDVDVALQAAETSLRYGESQLAVFEASPAVVCENPPPPGAGADPNGIWPTGAVQLNMPSWWNANGIDLEQDGATKQVAEAWEDPRHVVEFLQKVPESAVPLDDQYGGKNETLHLRITARGIGSTGATETLLRSIFKIHCS